MKRFGTMLFLLLCMSGMFAQHCPWDCSGMILIKTSISKTTVHHLNPVLVDEQKEMIIDTMYGTSKATYDSCIFLRSDDFTTYRTTKINIHQWYQYDTFYHFAAGWYIVKYNFCKYSGQRVYLRFSDPYSDSVLYHCVEVPDSMRVHLHNYSNQLFDRRTNEIRNRVKTSVIIMDFSNWGLKKDDCPAGG